MLLNSRIFPCKGKYLSTRSTCVSLRLTWTCLQIAMEKIAIRLSIKKKITVYLNDSDE